MVDGVPQMYLMQAVVAGEIANFTKFPPEQQPASFQSGRGAGAGEGARLTTRPCSTGEEHAPGAALH